MNVVPDITPKSEDTRWRLQQIGMYLAGAFAAGSTSLIAFAVNIEDGTGPYISWLRSQIAGWLTFAFALAIYKLVKWARVVRIERQRSANADAEKLAMAQMYFDVVKSWAKPTAPNTDTADVFVGVDPKDGQHLAGERQKMSPTELFEYVKMKHKAGLLAVSEIDALLKPIKGSEAFKSVRLWLLTRRGELMDKEETSRTFEL